MWAPFHFDDYAIFADPYLTAPSGAWEVWRWEQTRPLTYFTFWLNYAIGAESAIGYHALSLTIHIVSSLLLFACLRRLMPERAALIGSALFAIHPIQAEPVIYIFARAILLATLLCLVSLHLWLRGRHWWAVLAFLGALLAKEEAVAFPLFLFLLYLSISRNSRELRPIGAMLLLSVGLGLRVLFATKSVQGAGFNAGISAIDYFLTQGVAIWRYVQLLVVPIGFTVDPEIAPPPVWLGLLGWLAIAGLAVLSLKRFSKAREGFWLIGGLILLMPSSSILPAIDVAADRRMYLPLIALAGVTGLVLQRIRTAYVAVIAVGLTVLSIARTQVWLSERTLWAEAVDRSPGKVRPLIQLARVSGPEEALELMGRAEKLAPDDALVASEEGRVFLESGLPAESLSAFGRALALDPGSARALNNRGTALLALDQRDAAKSDFERALKVDPCLFEARRNLLRMGVDVGPLPPACRLPSHQVKELSDLKP